METKIIEVAGFQTRYVNKVTEGTLTKLYKVMSTFEKTRKESRLQGLGRAFKAVTEMLGAPLGSGHFGKVYDFSEEYVLKINNPNQMNYGGYNVRDGYIMEQLQGIAIIPQVFLYSVKNEFILIQKIKGKTCTELVESGEVKQFKDIIDFHWTKTFIEKCAEEVEARGWKLADCHGSNCMIDENGKFYIVDVGLFDNIQEIEGVAGSYFGRSTDCAIFSLLQIKETIEAMEVRDQRRKERMEARKGAQKVFSMYYEACPRCDERKHEEKRICDNCFNYLIVKPNGVGCILNYSFVIKYDYSNYTTLPILKTCPRLDELVKEPPLIRYSLADFAKRFFD
jgi:hypothetical protein